MMSGNYFATVCGANQQGRYLHIQRAGFDTSLGDCQAFTILGVNLPNPVTGKDSAIPAVFSLTLTGRWDGDHGVIEIVPPLVLGVSVASLPCNCAALRTA